MMKLPVLSSISTRRSIKTLGKMLCCCYLTLSLPDGSTPYGWDSRARTRRLHYIKTLSWVIYYGKDVV